MNTEFENNFPEYAASKNVPQLPTVSDIKNGLLSGGKLYIEYFVGDENIFIFYISEKGLEIISIDKPDNFNSLITDLQNALINPPKGSMSEAMNNFAGPAYKLYDLLLASVVNKSAEHKNLVIVPHDVLSYIPFEVLLNQPS